MSIVCDVRACGEGVVEGDFGEYSPHNGGVMELFLLFDDTGVRHTKRQSVVSRRWNWLLILTFTVTNIRVGRAFSFSSVHDERGACSFIHSLKVFR